MSERIVTINAGSSSVRLDVFDVVGTEPRRVGSRRVDTACDAFPMHELGALVDATGGAPEWLAHRIVHGGEVLSAARLVDGALRAQIAELDELAPLHNRLALEWIRACERDYPDCRQLAVPDTGLYGDLPAVARTYAIEADVAHRYGLRRYGFHGLAHAAMNRRWRVLSPGVASPRVISLQLGSGCSITATRDGRAVDTSMGFSPLEGLMMSTRSGDVDPGLLLHLQRVAGMSPAALEDWLNHRCGLLGVSGISADLRELIDSEAAEARLAVELFCYRARKYLGAFLAALDGADAILVGGGIGEHAPQVRSRIFEYLGWAGIELDPAANASATAGEYRIDATGSRTQLWVLCPDEATEMARQALQIIRSMK